MSKPPPTDSESIQSFENYQGLLSTFTSRAPILMIDDSLDGCKASPPTGPWPSAQALASMIDDPRFVLIDGGPIPPDGSDVCGGQAYHGFYENDELVVGKILDFIANHPH
jgi:hypothetical protein